MAEGAAFTAVVAAASTAEVDFMAAAVVSMVVDSVAEVDSAAAVFMRVVFMAAASVRRVAEPATMAPDRTDPVRMLFTTDQAGLPDATRVRTRTAALRVTPMAYQDPTRV